ncbi:hypothetical protein BGZ63DRAFT_411922 [Mariannaea sp. PMI_226]|nr:hypothetical protein BGZ63DRAFT_411922 [Mariannaea sp. PMI_226]
MSIIFPRPRDSIHSFLLRIPAFCQPSCFSGKHVKSPIEEEELAGDRLAAFHPTKPGDVLDGRFRTVAKLDFGTSSTKASVPRYVAINIPALDTDVSREAIFSAIINNANPLHDGLSFLRVPIDEFKLKAAAETLFRLQHRLERRRLALPPFKFFIYCLLQALDYLHTEYRVILTNIKDDNIIITIENEKILKEFVATWSVDGGEVYLSRDDFGRLQGAKLLPVRADFNLCYLGLRGVYGHLLPIQSHRYRALEVLLGCPWSYSVEIWNLGPLVKDMSLFERPAGEDGEYDAHVHLAQMHRLEEPMSNPRGDQCTFFDDDGKTFQEDLIDEGKNYKEKEIFLNFASCMLH